MTWDDVKVVASLLAMLAALAMLAMTEYMRRTFATGEQVRTQAARIDDLKQAQFETNTIAQTYIGKVDVMTQLLIDNQRQRDQLHEHFGKLSAQFSNLREQWTDMRERLARIETKLDLDIDERRAGRR